MDDVENGEERRVRSGGEGGSMDVDKNGGNVSAKELEELQPRTPSKGLTGSSNHKSLMSGSKRKARGVMAESPPKKSRTGPRVANKQPSRGIRDMVTPVDVDQEEANGESEVVSAPKTPQGSSYSKRELARLRTLQRELGIVAPAQEDNERAPVSRNSPSSIERITPKERTRRSILKRELGIVSSADEGLSNLREESRNRRTSSAASERISRQARFEAGPVNIFDEVLDDSDVELPKPRRSSESEVYLRKDGYKTLIGVRSRLPTSDDESVFEPSKSQRHRLIINSTPLRDSEGPPAGNSSAVKIRSASKGRETLRFPARSTGVASLGSPQNLSRGLIRKRPRLVNNKAEIPSSSAEEDLNSELGRSQPKTDSNANKKNMGQTSDNKSTIRPHGARSTIINTARIATPAIILPVSGKVGLRSTKTDGSSLAGTANNKPLEKSMESRQTKSPTGIQSNTRRRRDSVSFSSPAAMRMKRNRAADFFDDYEPRSPPAFSDANTQEEPVSMTILGDTQGPVEGDSMTARGDTQVTTDEPFSTAPMLQPNRETSPDSSYRTAVEALEQEPASQDAHKEVNSPPKSARKTKPKRQPAKSPYFPQITESPKKRDKAKAAETDNLMLDGTETPNTPKKISAASPNKRSPGGVVSCIPFPPLSSPTFGIIQEKLAHDPFRLLIAVTFLNRTRGKTAVPVFYELIQRYPTPEALSSAPKEDIVDIIRHLGFQNQRADTFKKYGKQWVDDPPMKDKRYAVRGYPEQDSGRDIKSDEILTDEDPRTAWEIGHMTQGPYAIDSWRIFCRDILRGVADSWNGENSKEENFQPEWMRVVPADKELRAYLRWMWLKEGFHWDPFTGEKEVAGRLLMVAAMEGRIAWDDLGGLRILDGDDEGTDNEKKKEGVDIRENGGEELDVNAVGIDGPPAERSLRRS